MRKKLLTGLILITTLAALGQNNHFQPAFWRLTGFSGEVRMAGIYKQQQIERPFLNEVDHAESYILTGGALLNLNSYFWHPDFFRLDIGAEYSPEQNKDNFEIIPDQAEIRTLKKLDLRSTFFQRKFISFTAFYNISETFSNREYLSNILTGSQTWGGAMFLRNRFLPLSVTYQAGKIDQEELETDRSFSYENSNLEGKIIKSFGRFDRHEITYTHSEFRRTEREITDVRNTLDELLLNNELFFDRKQRYRFGSMIILGEQDGYDSLTRAQVYESLTFKLPWKFELSGHYNYYNIDRSLQEITQQTARGILRHRLFESLSSSLFYEHTGIAQTGYDQRDVRKGIDLMYEKKIPYGQLSLSYKYLDQHQEKTGEAAAVRIYHEEYTLTDGRITLLRLPYVDITSVIVRDATGAVIYQLNLDYLLIQRGNYLEIQRVPGGQIPDNGLVYADYQALMPGNYEYDMKNQAWSAGVSLFRQFLNLYYRHMKQDYDNLVETDFVTLNYFTQEIIGCRLEYKGLSCGMEREENTSSIFPYELNRYFASFQGTAGRKILYALNGNFSDYYLVREKTDQTYADLSGQFVWQLTGRSKINFNGGYRMQEGEGIDLDLFHARVEYSTMIRLLQFSLGYQRFDRTYMDEIDRYNGLFFRIARRF